MIASYQILDIEEIVKNLKSEYPKFAALAFIQ